MKPFNEFWSSISEDEFCEIAKKVNKGVEQMRENTESPENSLGNQLAATSVMFTYEILSRYHEWISEQLEK